MISFAELEFIKRALDRNDLDALAAHADAYLDSASSEQEKYDVAASVIEVLREHDHGAVEQLILHLLRAVTRFEHHYQFVDLKVTLSDLQRGNGRIAAATITLEDTLDFVVKIEGHGSQLARELKEQIAALYREQGNDLRAAQLESEIQHIGDSTGSTIQDRNIAVEGIDFTVATIFYGTNRQQLPGRNPYRKFGGDRGPLSLGQCRVSIPTRRLAGTMEMPTTRETRKIDPKVDLSKVFFIRSIEQLSTSKFTAELQRNTLLPAAEKEVLLYLHGYYNSFAYAISTAAQLGADLHINGPTVLYSWPSKDSAYSYVADRGSIIEPIKRDIRDFISIIMKAVGKARVYIIAHSMGCNYLVDSLFGGMPPRQVKEIVLASADIDVDHFRGIYSRLRPASRRFTIYTSREDIALRASQTLHEGQIRVGREADALEGLELDAIETARVNEYRSLRTTGRHSDYILGALDDLRSVIWLGLAADRRKTIARGDGIKNGWVLKVEKDASRGDAYRPGESPFGQALRLIRSAQLGGSVTRDEIYRYLKSRQLMPHDEAVARELEEILK